MLFAVTDCGSQFGKHGQSMFNWPKKGGEKPNQHRNLVSSLRTSLGKYWLSFVPPMLLLLASLKLRRVAWRAWREYVLVRREKRGVQREVNQWAATRALRYSHPTTRGQWPDPDRETPLHNFLQCVDLLIVLLTAGLLG